MRDLRLIGFKLKHVLMPGNDEETTLSVAPGSPVRTWKQNVSYLPSPVQLQRGEEARTRPAPATPGR